MKSHWSDDYDQRESDENDYGQRMYERWKAKKQEREEWQAFVYSEVTMLLLDTMGHRTFECLEAPDLAHSGTIPSWRKQ